MKVRKIAKMISKSDIKREKAYRRKQEKKKIETDRVIQSFRELENAANKVVESLGGFENV